MRSERQSGASLEGGLNHCKAFTQNSSFLDDKFYLLQLHQFPRATVANYHSMDGLKQQDIFFHSSGSQSLKSTNQQVSSFWWLQYETILCFSPSFLQTQKSLISLASSSFCCHQAFFRLRECNFNFCFTLQMNLYEFMCPLLFFFKI